ncbi:MAG: glucosaminidase domain-containing protein [Chryseolinea sp.]
MKPKEYIKKFRKFIMDSLQGSKLLPSLMMAQALYEAADDRGNAGESIHAKKYNNDIRILADKSWKGPKVKLPARTTTKNNKPARKAWFRIYSSSESSIADRIKMLTLKVEAWPTTFWYNDTVKQQARVLQIIEISADPGYGQRMFDIVNRHKLYLMDRQWWIEKAARLLLSAAMCFILRYLLHNWDSWVPWRN